MSDLISRKALLERLHFSNAVSEITLSEAIDIITNAPAVEQCEPVAWALFYDNGVVHHVTKYEPPTKNGSHLGYKPLYTAPPQPKPVKAALEKAASICKDKAKDYREFAEPFAANICEEIEAEIRALIEKE